MRAVVNGVRLPVRDRTGPQHRADRKRRDQAAARGHRDIRDQAGAAAPGTDTTAGPSAKAVDRGRAACRRPPIRITRGVKPQRDAISRRASRTGQEPGTEDAAAGQGRKRRRNARSEGVFAPEACRQTDQDGGEWPCGPPLSPWLSSVIAAASRTLDNHQEGLVVGAVTSESVSSRFSLFSGKIQGLELRTGS